MADGASESAHISEHMDNAGVMLVLLCFGVLALRKALIYVGDATGWNGLVGFAK